jgi:hypothetical protein
MQIERVDGGFWEIIQKRTINKLFCDYNGICTIYFYDKSPKELNVGCSVYNRQYGLQISEDEHNLFVGSWEKGLRAYDIESGSLLWKSSDRKIRYIFVYTTYLIALKANGAVFKYDINNGTKIGEIKSGSIEDMYDLGFPYIYVDAVKGKQSIIDVEKMLVVKKYSEKIVNPFNYLSVSIKDIVLRDNVLTISGTEEYPNKDYSKSGGIAFSRVIDSDFGAREF